MVIIHAVIAGIQSDLHLAVIENRTFQIDGYLMQIESRAESSNRSFLHDFQPEISYHLHSMSYGHFKHLGLYVTYMYYNHDDN